MNFEPVGAAPFVFSNSPDAATIICAVCGLMVIAVRVTAASAKASRRTISFLIVPVWVDQETLILGREKFGLRNLSKGSLRDLSTAAAHLAPIDAAGGGVRAMGSHSVVILDYCSSRRFGASVAQEAWLDADIAEG
jgi:hypothetical protein